MKHVLIHLPFCMISCTIIHIADYKWHMFDKLIALLVSAGLL